MMARREGRIVFVSSGLALVAYAGYSAYAPAKYAVRGLAVRALAKAESIGKRVFVFACHVVLSPKLKNK